MDHEIKRINATIGEIRIFFDENFYGINKDTLKEHITALIMNGDLIGANLDLADYGFVIIYYNPVKPKTSLKRINHAAETIVKYIESCTPAES